MMNYETILKTKVIEGLQELSDEAFQRRVWLASSGPEVSSFDEAICGLFNDSGLDSLLESSERPSVLTDDVYDGLRELSRLVGRAARTLSSLPPIAVIEHPKMREIRAIAGNILVRATKKEPQ
jgi:hypothetical protein